MPWTILASLFSWLPGSISTYLKAQSDLSLAQVQAQQAIVLAQVNAQSAEATAQAQLNQTIVNSTGNYFKYFTFFMWFGPFMIGIFDPTKSTFIFSNLQTMPTWYVQSCMLIMFTVWGISVSQGVVANIFGGLTSYLGDRRSDGIELAKAQFDHDKFFAALKKYYPNGLPQAVVNADNDAINQATITPTK